MLGEQQRSKQTKQQHQLNPKTTHLEFFGSFGCTLLVLLLPIITISLNALCTQSGCFPTSFPAVTDSYTLLFRLSYKHSLMAYPVWFVFQSALYVLVPGVWVNGVRLRTDDTLTYKINAFRCLIVTHIIYAIIYSTYGIAPFIWISQTTLELLVSALLFSTLQSMLLYVASFRSKEILLSTVGNSSSPIHDFWMGRELNPRFRSWDLKYFCELRPGLFLWGLLNYAYMAKQYTDFGSVSGEMLFVVLSQGVYILDSSWFEQAILCTMDITTDGFGYMLVVGDLLWVPFTFSLQARYLSLYPLHLSSSTILALSALFCIGFTVFRASKSQKNEFRMTENKRNLKYITTEHGSKLLVDGWWRMSRHINYFGDWMIGLSWCLATGFNSPVPYWYLMYFVPLLVHRAMRDDTKCRGKYGRDWERYCDGVPWRIIPFVY